MKKIIFWSLRVSILCILTLLQPVDEVRGQRLSRDLNVDLLVNQIGYAPVARKICVARGSVNGTFEVVDLKTQTVVYTGVLKPGGSDLGDYSIGDFSDVAQPGHYYVKADTLRSYPFAISNSIYHAPMDLIVGYFSRQRCGSSTTGYLSPCHIDDGVRIDNGRHQDVSGGWHDASDLRKWVGATIYGMIGLAKSYELRDTRDGYRQRIMEELRWGNQYFLNMQEPQGYVMSFVGGDVKKHSDSNRWTDNAVSKEGGELRMTKPTAGRSGHDMLIFGSSDDRVIETAPLDIIGQFNFITAQALMSRLTKVADSDYSQECLRAALKCFDWCNKTNKETSPSVLGSSIQASVELYKTTKEDKYKDFAVAQAAQLRKLQAESDAGDIGGFFYSSFTDQEPHKDIWHGCLEFISMCDLIETFPSHKDAPSWKEAIAAYSHRYLSVIAQKNAFGIVPYGLFTKSGAEANRQVGKYGYRYFMQPDPTWWVGINSNISSAGIGLVRAGRILNDRKLEALAQRQLDWILGVNPFNSSTMAGVGYNHPEHFGGSSFNPLTPVIPGAVMNGLGGDDADQAIIGKGDWQISEYWTPMVAHTLWLMSELSDGK